MADQNDPQILHDIVVTGITGAAATSETALEALNLILTKADLLAQAELPTRDLLLVALSNFRDDEKVLTTSLNILHAILSGPQIDAEDISSVIDILFRTMANNLTSADIVARVFAVFCVIMVKLDLHAQLYSNLTKAIPVIVQQNGDSEETINAVGYFLYLVFKFIQGISDFENDGILDAIFEHCREHSNSSLIMVLVGYMVVYDYGSLANLADDALPLVKKYAFSHFDSWFGVRALNFLLQGQIPAEVIENEGPSKLLRNIRNPGPEESDQKLLRESCRFFTILNEQGITEYKQEAINAAKQSLFNGAVVSEDDPDLKWYFVMIPRLIKLLESLQVDLDQQEFQQFLHGSDNNGLLESLTGSTMFDGDFGAAIDTLLFLARNNVTKDLIKQEGSVLTFVNDHVSLFPQFEHKTIALQSMLQ